MSNTFSNITIRVKTIAGLVFAVVGVCVFDQSVSNFTQGHSKPGLSAQSAVSHAWVKPLIWKAAPSTVEFNPEPNPEPISTGGTGTR